ncbi:MAG: polysaccharide pyruvyl transferase family protein [Aminipila sp.]
MKKIGICAAYNTKNYGSMLQALATQIKVGELGYDYEIIQYKKKMTPLFVLKSLPRLFNPIFVKGKLRGIKKGRKIKKYPEIEKQNSQRNERFQRFIDDYFKKKSPIYLGYDVLKNNARNYGAVLVGSDQLWLPSGLASNFYNLMFVPNDILKVAYATSFGVSVIPSYQIKRTKEYLNRIEYLAVRELKGQEIIKNLTGRESEVVVDPTLLLSSKEWSEVIPNKEIINEPYIFCYFLGTNPKHRELAQELKEKTGMQIIFTPHLDDFVEGDLTFGDKQLFDIGPDDFVNLIRNANYICTDSFHGTVFAILHHKKFITFNRFMEGANSRNSRIDSLCTLLGLDSRRYHCDIFNEMIQEIDYVGVENKLGQLRNSSLKYLQNALSSTENK